MPSLDEGSSTSAAVNSQNSREFRSILGGLTYLVGGYDEGDGRSNHYCSHMMDTSLMKVKMATSSMVAPVVVIIMMMSSMMEC